MSVADKLITIANNTPLVCENLGTKKTASGNPAVVGDVIPIEHGLKINLTSESITDFSGIEVSKCGKNLIPYPYEHTTKTANGVTFTDNGDGSITLNGTPTATATFYLYTNRYNQTILKKGKQYTLSLNGSPSRGNIYINTNAAQIWEGAWGGAMGSTNSSNKETFTCDADYQGYQVYLVVTKNAGTLNNVTICPQLEIGLTATKYELYKQPQTATANTDGTVEGLRSVSPNMTLFADNNDVVINCKYRSVENPTANEKIIELQNVFTNAKETLKKQLY